jgi:hypothetical protein
VKARQEGLQTVLYKPFRADRLMDAVEQALRTTSSSPPRQSAAQHQDGAQPQSPASSFPPSSPASSPSSEPVRPNAPSQTPGEQKPSDAQPIEASHHEP